MSENWQWGAVIDSDWLDAQEAFGRWIDANPDHPAVAAYRELSRWSGERGIDVDLYRLGSDGPLRILSRAGFCVDFRGDPIRVTVETSGGYREEFPEGLDVSALVDLIAELA